MPAQHFHALGTHVGAGSAQREVHGLLGDAEGGEVVLQHRAIVVQHFATEGAQHAPFHRLVDLVLHFLQLVVDALGNGLEGVFSAKSTHADHVGCHDRVFQGHVRDVERADVWLAALVLGRHAAPRRRRYQTQDAIAHFDGSGLAGLRAPLEQVQRRDAAVHVGQYVDGLAQLSQGKTVLEGIEHDSEFL